MGWSLGYDKNWHRDVGYGVPAYCDHPGCGKEIDRGLAYVCGDEPYGGEYGCGLFFCEDHKQRAGDRRENKSLCVRCYTNRGKKFDPTPDHPAWIKHKLTDQSWKTWRNENPAEVEKLKIMVRTKCLKT